MFSRYEQLSGFMPLESLPEIRLVYKKCKNCICSDLNATELCQYHLGHSYTSLWNEFYCMTHCRSNAVDKNEFPLLKSFCTTGLVLGS